MVVLSTETCTINLALTGGLKSPHEVGRYRLFSDATHHNSNHTTTVSLFTSRHSPRNARRETTKTPHKNLGLHQHDWEEGTAELDEDGASARCWLQKKGTFVLDEFANFHRVVAAARFVAVAGARLVAFFGLAVEVVVGVIAAAPALVAPLSSRELVVSFAHVHAQLRGNGK